MALPVICLHLVMWKEYHLYDETLSPHKNCPVCHPRPGVLAKSKSPTGQIGWERQPSPSGIKPLIWKKRKILVWSNEISWGKKGILKGKKPNVLNSGLAPPIKMQINKAEDYWNQGPLIYEDPNSMGPKDRYILVWTNMFDSWGIHPLLLQKYVEESLKSEENLKLLKSLM